MYASFIKPRSYYIIPHVYVIPFAIESQTNRERKRDTQVTVQKYKTIYLSYHVSRASVLHQRVTSRRIVWQHDAFPYISRVVLNDFLEIDRRSIFRGGKTFDRCIMFSFLAQICQAVQGYPRRESSPVDPASSVAHDVRSNVSLLIETAYENHELVRPKEWVQDDDFLQREKRCQNVSMIQGSASSRPEQGQRKMLSNRRQGTFPHTGCLLIILIIRYFNSPISRSEVAGEVSSGSRWPAFVARPIRKSWPRLSHIEIFVNY